MPESGILEVELFDIYGIDLMGPFPYSHKNLCILLAVCCISKRVEAIASLANDSTVVIRFF